VGKQVIGELSNTFWCFFQFDFLLGFYCESRLRIGVNDSNLKTLFVRVPPLALSSSWKMSRTPIHSRAKEPPLCKRSSIPLTVQGMAI
jgi:hypothetical protein